MLVLISIADCFRMEYCAHRMHLFDQDHQALLVLVMYRCIVFMYEFLISNLNVVCWNKWSKTSSIDTEGQNDRMSALILWFLGMPDKLPWLNHIWNSLQIKPWHLLKMHDVGVKEDHCRKYTRCITMFGKENTLQIQCILLLLMTPSANLVEEFPELKLDRDPRASYDER